MLPLSLVINRFRCQSVGLSICLFVSYKENPVTPHVDSRLERLPQASCLSRMKKAPKSDETVMLDDSTDAIKAPQERALEK